VILQASANPDEVAVFLFDNGRLCGPAAFSTLGMRIQNEQSGSTSLFAQPLAIEATPEKTEIREQRAENRGQGTVGEESSAAEAKTEARESHVTAAPKLARSVLESRLEATLAALAQNAAAPSATVRQGHLALLKRWYYRPEAKRNGEIFFPDAEDHWPVKAILRGVGRVVANLALILPRIALTVAEARRGSAVLRSWLEDSSSIVKTAALDGLAAFTRHDPASLPQVSELLRIHSRSGTAAMRARSRILLKKLSSVDTRRSFIA
jgi:hypothetical protein